VAPAHALRLPPSLDEVGYRPYSSSAERTAALGPWLTHYNFTRPHGGLNHKPPASRLTKAPRNNG
jgi:transposase InsO family protein